MPLTLDYEVADEKVAVFFHLGPHYEEILALYLLLEYGTKGFLNEYCCDGRVHLGCEGGPFDEHPRNGHPRKERECCATLAAKALGVDEDPTLVQLLRFALYSDTGRPQFRNDARSEECSHPFDFSKLVVSRWRDFRKHRESYDDERAVIDRTLNDIRIFHEGQIEFLDAVRDVEQAQTFTVRDSDKDLRVVIVKSDNVMVSRAARYKCRADLIVQWNASGHVHIFPVNGLNRVYMDDLAQILNVCEQRAEGDVSQADWSVLRREGRIDGGVWYRTGHDQLHTETESYPCDMATRLSYEAVEWAVRLALDQQRFDPEREDQCKSGVCSSTKEASCRHYSLGLRRCRQIRWSKYAKVS